MSDKVTTVTTTTKSGNKKGKGGKNKPKQPKTQIVKKIERVQAKPPKPRADNKHPLSLAYGRAVVDPWNFNDSCPPDGATNSGCITSHANALLETGSSGTCCSFAMIPNPEGQFYTDTKVANATTPTFGSGSNWTAVSQIAAVRTGFATMRPVSAGFKLNYIGPTTGDQGFVVAGCLTQYQPVSILNGLAADQVMALLNDFRIIPLKSASGFTITWRPEDEDAAADFVDLTGNNVTLNSQQGYQTLVAIVYGAASSAALLNIEYIANYQLKFLSSSLQFGGRLDTGHAEPGWYESAANLFSQVKQFSFDLPWENVSSASRLVAQAMSYGRGRQPMMLQY